MLRTFAGGLLALLLAGCATIHVTEKTWANPGYAILAPKALHALSSHDYTAQSHYFKSSDGTTLHGLLLTNPNAKVTVLYLGGNVFQTGTAGLEIGKQLEGLGVDALLLDYPGYGGSEGKADLASTRAAVLAAFDNLRSLPSLQGKPIAVWGMSLGSVLAPMVVNARPAQALVLESAPTNVSDWIHNQVPWYATPFIRIDIANNLLPIDNCKVLANWHKPLLVLVGSKDNITPPAFARKLYEASATPAADKILFVAPGRGHGEASGDPAALAALHKFFDGLPGHG
ncbi:MAG TPA: prolyl oligopeptidase family serine peptidase [Rhodanobacter sp.]|nr:prolyl oligopeptidase family serine peptidase [Rhodanobacter sp.]